MRLAISTRTHYHADIYCADTRAAKKALKEKTISVVAIDFYLAGREDGGALLLWAKQHNVLPSYIVIIERDREKRFFLGQTLKGSGYRSADDTTFIKP